MEEVINILYWLVVVLVPTLLLVGIIKRARTKPTDHMKKPLDMTSRPMIEKLERRH